MRQRCSSSELSMTPNSSFQDDGVPGVFRSVQRLLLNDAGLQRYNIITGRRLQANDSVVMGAKMVREADGRRGTAVIVVGTHWLCSSSSMSELSTYRFRTAPLTGAVRVHEDGTAVYLA